MKLNKNGQTGNNWSRKGAKEALAVYDTKDYKVDIANFWSTKIGDWEKVNKLCFKDSLQWSKISLEQSHN